MSAEEYVPQLSDSMLADLAALSKGEQPPERVWHERPWKAGEPCWMVWVEKDSGCVHIYPCRITRYDRWIMESDPSIWTPMVEFQLDVPEGSSVMMMPKEELHLYEMVKVLPRLVEGETW